MAYNPKDKNPSGVVLFGNNGSDQVFESITDFVYDTGNTRLGISTSSPQYTLDVSGTGAFHTIRFADGTEMTTSGGGGGGGTTYTAGSGLTLDGTEFNVTGQSAQKIFTINASDSSNYIFDGMGLNSANDPTIYLHKGHTYYFNKQTASHPFVISATDGGSVYQDADGNNIQINGEGTLKFEVPQNAPDKLYYYCSSHASAMKGEIYTTTNIDDIDTISGLLYNHWVISDGSNSGIISSLNTLRFTESGQTSIVFDSGTNTLTIGSTGAGGGGGGGTNWNLSVEGDSTNIGDGETVDFTGQGNITLSRSSNTVIISGAAGGGGGGGGTPGGSNTQVQFNDGGSFGGSPAFTFDGSTVTITGTGLLFDVRNVSADILFSIEDTNESSIIAAAQAGQTGYILDIRDEFDTTIAYIDPTGFISVSGVIFPDGVTQTIAYTGGGGGGGGGGGTPGGSVNQIQINDGAGGFTAATNSDRFLYNDSTNTFDLGRQSADNVAGGQFTNYWFANNFCIGGGNFSATMDSDANNNTAVGIDALGALTFGDDNVAIGYQAGDAITASDDNTIIGSQAGSAFGNSINDNRNVIIGYQAANAATDIASNVIIGYQAGLSAAGPDGSVIIGSQAGYDSDADYNVLIGYQCGYKADGNYNIYIGKPQSSAVGTPNVTGSGNLILGWNFDPNNNSIHGNPNGYSATASQQFAIANSLVGDFSAQRIGVGEAAINALDATLHVLPKNSSDLVLKVQGAAAQSANLQEWRNSSDTELASVGPSGRLYYQSSYSPISNEGTASSFTFDLDTSNVFSGTLSAASTLTTSNGDVGQRFLVRLRQGSGGSKTVSSWFGGRVSWPGGSAPTLSSTAGHVDLFGFLVTHGTAPTLYYDGFTIATGIQ